MKSLQKAEVYLEPMRAGLYIGLWKYWDFQSEAKVEQIIAIVTTHSVSCWQMYLQTFLPTIPGKLLPQPPNLLFCLDISRFYKFFKERLVSSISLEEIIIDKFLIEIYKEATPHCDSFSLFLIMALASLVPSAII